MNNKNHWVYTLDQISLLFWVLLGGQVLMMACFMIGGFFWTYPYPFSDYIVYDQLFGYTSPVPSSLIMGLSFILALFFGVSASVCEARL